jgi:hypothetical protein
MSLSKEKLKVDSECRTDEYVGVSINGKALCLICSESTAVLKEYSVARQYN